MIATILPGSPNFHAVGYNERKVSMGVARLIEIQNFGTIGNYGKPTADEMVSFLMAYSSRNTRIQKPQFHVAFSCKGHEMTESELLAFAHRYLTEMGYGEPGQPLLVYSHHDTDNTHLHVITSRVAPDGRKITHDHERRKSQEVIEHILGNDRGKEADKAMEAAKQYTFSTFAQYKAVMSSLGYETYQKDGTVFIKRGGSVLRTIKLDEIEALFKDRQRSKARCRQLRSILKKYRDVSSNKEELRKEMKEKFGVDIIFFGKKDAAYGYMIVDHANKTVIHGARVLAVEELLDFATPEQRLDRIEDFIERMLALNPKATQGQIYAKIRKQRAYIKKGVLHFDGQERPLKPSIAEAIDRNNRIERVEKFKPATEAERDLLCRIYKVSRPDLVALTPERTQAHADAVGRIRELFDDETPGSVKGKLFQEGFILRQNEQATYAVNFKNQIVVNLTEEGFDLKRLQRKPAKKKKARHPAPKHRFRGRVNLGKFRNAGIGSHGEKREWEVGRKGNYDDIDDGRSMKW